MFKYFIFLISFSLSAQIKGIVKDSISGEPIPYVNIWVENEVIGTTSDVDGSFSLNTSFDKKIVFSSIGYDKKTVIGSKVSVVNLFPNEVELNEVVLVKKKNSKLLEIGKPDNTIHQTFDSGPKLEAKFFPYSKKYEKTKFVKYITLLADCGIDSATVKLHIYDVGKDGLPGNELLTNNVIKKVKKGVFKYKFNVSDFNITIPENGLFVAVEKLMINSNKLQRITEDKNTGLIQEKITYYPLIIYNYVDRDFFCVFYGGSWHKKINEENPEEMIGGNEPAITLILSN